MEQDSWKILIVDENQEDCAAICDMLKNSKRGSYHLDCVSHCDEGWEKLRGVSYDSIFIDTDVDPACALDFTRRITTSGFHLPVILLASQDSEEFDEQAMQAGAIICLTKSDLSTRLLERSIHFAIKQKQTEERLNASEQRLADLIRCAPAGIYEIDFRTGRFTTVNDSMCELSGYSREELLNLTGFDLLTDESKQRFQQRVQRWLAGETPEQNVEYQVIAKDGRIIDVVLNVRFTKDDQGRPLGATVVGFDVTDRNQAEKKVNESKQRIEGIVESITDGFLELDRDFRFTFANRRAAENVGHAQEDLIGKNLWETFPMILGTEQEEIYRQAMEQRKTIFMEAYGNITDRWYQYRFYPSTAGITVFWTDITERKQNEQALKKANQDLINERNRLLVVMESIPIGLAIYDEKGGVIQANNHFEEVWGQPRPPADSVEDYDLYQAWWVENGERVKPEEWAAARAVQDGETVNGQFIRIRRFDGTDGYVLNSGAPIRDAEGKVTGGIVAIMDVTGQVRAERELRESEERFRLSSRAVTGVLYDATLDRQHVFQSEGLERIVGYKPGEEPGGSKDWWPRNIHPDDFPRIQKELQAAYEDGSESVSYEYRIRHKDGHWVHVWDQAYIVRDPSGKPVRIVGTATDISDRKRAEEALRASEERFRVAISSLPMTVYMTDKDLRYTWIYHPRFGLSPKEILGKRDDELYPPEMAAQFTAPKRAAVESGQRVQVEIQVVMDGQNKNFLLTLDPLHDSSGEIIGIIGASLDVTEQRKAEIERREMQMQMEIQRQLMDIREKDRQAIARDIHDGPIQTLASSLFGIQVAKGALQDPALLLEMEHLSSSVQDAIHELREVMNELRPPALIRFGLARTIKSHVEELREKQSALQVHLELDDDPRTLSPTLTLTLFRIYQEAMNNILKHAEATEVTVRFLFPGEKVILEIQDNGKGFDVLHDPTTRILSGHYGLAGMKERTEAVGGQFQVHSSPGGTRIRIEVPVG